MTFLLVMIFLVAQRIAELVVARRNEKWLLANGAVEYGKEHYPLIVILHTAFIFSLIAEYMLNGHVFYWWLLAVYILLVVAKTIIISTLGHYWNTRIYRIPGSKPVATGIYKYIKHPNYVIVICEIAVIPMIFGLYYTAIIFSILNAMMLTVRIRVENKALAL
jgi:methyltransferase